VDAYSNYILRASHDRLGELRREAAEHAMSRAARRGRRRWWRLHRGPAPLQPAPVRCPVCKTPLALTVGELPVDELVGASP
jgi:hypothetical protein